MGRKFDKNKKSSKNFKKKNSSKFEKKKNGNNEKVKKGKKFHKQYKVDDSADLQELEKEVLKVQSDTSSDDEEETNNYYSKLVSLFGDSKNSKKKNLYEDEGDYDLNNVEEEEDEVDEEIAYDCDDDNTDGNNSSISDSEISKIKDSKSKKNLKNDHHFKSDIKDNLKFKRKADIGNKNKNIKSIKNDAGKTKNLINSNKNILKAKNIGEANITNNDNNNRIALTSQLTSDYTRINKANDLLNERRWKESDNESSNELSINAGLVEGDSGDSSSSSSFEGYVLEISENGKKNITKSKRDYLLLNGNSNGTEEIEQNEGLITIDDDDSDGDDENNHVSDDNSQDADYRDPIIIDGLEDGDDNDDDDAQMETNKLDPFINHYSHELNEKEASSMIELIDWSSEKIEVPYIGFAKLIWPSLLDKPVDQNYGEDIDKFHIKSSLIGQLLDSNNKYAKVDLPPNKKMTDFQSSLFSNINSYKDVYFSQRNMKNDGEIRVVYCLHALNHMLKTRNTVISHSNKLKDTKNEVPEEFRDQGFTRPKILMVLPFRSSAFKVVNIMIELLMADKAFVSNKSRFIEEFGPDDLDAVKGKKPEDYEWTFDGNIDDNFRIGLAVAKKSLKLYTNFYASDIIIASPLGLRNVILNEGEKGRDFDFLSSIEVLIMDQTDVFLMQNWEPILHFLSHMHHIPSEPRGIDFSRVRMWSINGWSKLYRQTLIFSSFQTPEINSIFNKNSFNYEGKLMFMTSRSTGSICDILGSLNQVFQRFEVNSCLNAADKRFEYFIKQVLPKFKNSVKKNIFIFISSYYDFVRLRNYFTKEELEFQQTCEYTKDKDVSHARKLFFHGEAKYLLYTERFHFFKRYKMRGIRHLIFYDLPIYSHFYNELCNSIYDPKRPIISIDQSCTVLFNKYDAHRLLNVVGSDRANHMITSDKDTFLLVSGDK